MEKFFQLKKHGTKFSTEVIAGITTFFAMAYIIFVNPSMLSLAGTPDNPFPAGGIFLATIIASIIGTLIMGLFANVPYAQAPGMGLNAFFTFTVCGALGYTWQEALAMVFLCGIINILITVTKLRKLIIKAIPESLQNAIGGGIGIFIAYIGLKNAGLFSFTADPGTYTMFGTDPATSTVVTNSSVVPGLVSFNDPGVLLAVFGIILMVVLVVCKVKGGVFIAIVGTTLVSIILALLNVQGVNGAVTDAMATGSLNFPSLGDTFGELGVTFGAAFGSKGMGSLFGNLSKLPQILMTIFAFSLSDTFDTIGTFIGTGRRTGIFDAEDQKALESGTGFKSKMDKALFADSVATSIGAIFGTSNTTTYVESAAGIGAGGRTGLTSVVTAIFFAASILLAPVIGFVPAQATAPALIIVGIMMMASFADIRWTDMEEAVPAFFATIFMGFAYSISNGIAAGFLFYCIVKVIRGKAKEVHPVMWVSTALFILNFIVLAIL
ncbi:MAG: NCS2 family permease [Oscillospiraceae bacterium]